MRNEDLSDGTPMPADEKLQYAITEAIRRDRRLSAQEIEVLVSRGMITLLGTVQSYRRKLVAERIAASFPECRGISNQLIVEPPGQLSDKEISDHLRAALAAHAELGKATIVVSVSGGVATISGNVVSNWERYIAEDVALSVHGVREVENLLMLDSEGWEEDEALSREIQASLKTRVRGVSVAVTEGAVVLSGSVPSLWQKLIAEQIARTFPIMRIRNEITVEHTPGAEGPMTTTDEV